MVSFVYPSKSVLPVSVQEILIRVVILQLAEIRAANGFRHRQI